MNPTSTVQNEVQVAKTRLLRLNFSLVFFKLLQRIKQANPLKMK